MKIRRTDPAELLPPKPKPPKTLSPRTQARIAQEQLLDRTVISKLASPDDAFEIRLEPGEKLATIRQRLLKVAAERHVEIAVRIREERVIVGLMTPERRSRRGRRPKAAPGD